MRDFEKICCHVRNLFFAFFLSFYQLTCNFGGFSTCFVCWLALQTPVDCIPHPYHIYTKWFSTLICCGLAYGSTLMLIYLWRWAFYQLKCVFGGFTCFFVCWLALQTPVDCIPHPHHVYTKCLVPLYTVDEHMGAPLHCYACAGGG